MKGSIFNIQRFSLDDGPGIRTVVFLQGCNLLCRWCHNPESLGSMPVVMRSADCVACGRCARVCKQHVLDAGGKMIDRSRCILCGDCIEACSIGARRISGRVYEPEELQEILLKDYEYYEMSGGGVTFSGGEPTIQLPFLTKMLRILKTKGVNCAIESNGLISEEAEAVILNGAEYAMIDLKHCDTEKHKKEFGVGNERVLQTIDNLSRFMPVEVRMPVIPGFNDRRDDIEGVIKIALEKKAVCVRFLPYHVFGVQKYRSLDYSYSLDNILPLSKNDVLETLEQIPDYGIEVKV